MIFGTFDYFHPGHAFVLTEAQKRGKVHVVVAQDATVKRLKGVFPHHSLAARIATIAAQFPEVQVLPGNADGDFLEPIRTVKPDLIVLGYDQALPPGIQEADLGVPVERLSAFEPEKWKSSKLRTSSK